MRGCAVCGEAAAQRCGGCGNVSYCGQAHQKKHWASHRPSCAPCRTVRSKELGSYLVAGRALAAGALVVEEEVGVLGPAEEGCLGCSYPVHSYRCRGCGAPLCGPSCESSGRHPQECPTLARHRVGERLAEEPQLLWLVTPLRLLLLRSSDPARYKKCRALSTNLEERRGQGDFPATQARARQFVELFPGLATEEEVLHILCLLDTNTFQVLASGCAASLSGLYPRAALLNHSCSPNCRLVFRSDYSLQVVTSVGVVAGTPLHISYNPPFYSLLARRTILLRGKQFLCQCARCLDPLEGGARLSSLRCSSCSSGHLLPSSPALLHCPWACDSCSATVPAEEYAARDAALLRIQTSMDKEDVAGLRAVVAEHAPALHPQHALLAEARQHLAAALGRAEGHRWDQLGEAGLREKVAVSEELLQLCSLLEPGLSKCRGITLLDLVEARARLLHLTAEGTTLLAGLAALEADAREADTILSLEDEASIEGNVAKMAREQLGNIRAAMAHLRRGGK